MLGAGASKVYVALLVVCCYGFPVRGDHFLTRLRGQAYTYVYFTGLGVRTLRPAVSGFSDSSVFLGGLLTLSYDAGCSIRVL